MHRMQNALARLFRNATALIDDTRYRLIGDPGHFRDIAYGDFLFPYDHAGFLLKNSNVTVHIVTETYKNVNFPLYISGVLEYSKKVSFSLFQPERRRDLMRAAIITKPGGPEVLEIQEVETPQPQGEQVLVRVRAAGLNRADLLQRAGFYPAPPGAPEKIPGMEFAGEVVAVGPPVRTWKPGQRVMGIIG